MTYKIRDVLDRIDLVALMDEFTIGSNRRWHCPVVEHDDQNPSVTISVDKKHHERWRCWSGDHRGDAVDLVMHVRGCTRGQAIEWLAIRAGVDTGKDLPPVVKKKVTPRVISTTLSPLVKQYVQICASVLRSNQGIEVRSWLRSRGISDETIKANLIGVDLGCERMLGDAITRRKKGLPSLKYLAAVFPAFDEEGNITYFQTRYLDADQAGRKYDNPTSKLGPHPRMTFPISSSMRDKILLVCEGIPDALIANQEGFRSVGLLGTQTPDKAVADRLMRFAYQKGLRIVIAADPDEAGEQMRNTLIELLEGDISYLVPPNGQDINAWALNDPDWHNQVRDLTIDAWSSKV